MLDELVWPANTHYGSRDLGFRQVFDNGTTEPIVKDVIFERAHHVYPASEKLDRAGV